MANRRILFLVLSSMAHGGVNVRQARLARHLASNGWEAVFGVSWGKRYHRPEAFEQLYPDLECVRLDGRSGNADGRLVAIQRALRRVRPHVLAPGHVVDAYQVLGGISVAWRQRLRVIAGLYTLDARYVRDLLANQPYVDQAMAVSQFGLRVLRRVIGFPNERTHLIPTGVPIPSVPVTHAAGPEIRLAFVGRFAEDKRPMDFVEICRRLRRLGRKVRAWMAGDGPLRDQLLATVAAEPNLGIEILPLLRAEQVYAEVYPRIHYCCLTSPAEGMPNSMLEAMAHGIVPVASDFMGRESDGVLRHLETALVFPVGDVERAAALVSDLHGDVAERERISRNARAAVVETRSLPSMASAFARMLDLAWELPAVRAPRMDQQRGRLTRWLGPRAAEAVRWCLGRQYVHADASEWPSTLTWSPEELSLAAAAVAELPGNPPRKPDACSLSRGETTTECHDGSLQPPVMETHVA